LRFRKASTCHGQRGVKLG
jgi:hypothetical protein